MAPPGHRPRLVLIVRHGESEANCDWNINSLIPNHTVRLTPHGRAQAVEAGEKIRKLIRSTDRVAVYSSPYERARETANEIIGVLGNVTNTIERREDPRLREQDFGNFQNPEAMQGILAERDTYGFFFYRIPNGESPADVYDRCSSFCDTLHRHFERHEPDVVLLVSHGIWGRVFLMRWFYWTYETFESLENLPNAGPVIMERLEEGGYRLVTQLHHHTKLV